MFVDLCTIDLDTFELPRLMQELETLGERPRRGPERLTVSEFIMEADETPVRTRKDEYLDFTDGFAGLGFGRVRANYVHADMIADNFDALRLDVEHVYGFSRFVQDSAQPEPSIEI